MTSPKVGDRVKVTEVREGIVSDSSGDGTLWLVKQSRPVHLGIDRADYSASVEVLPPPGPTWRHGDVVRTANNFVVLRDAVNNKWRFPDGSYRRDADPVPLSGPLTLLVRDGKPA